MNRTIRCLVVLASLGIALATPAFAQQTTGADLNISPKRLVLGGASRSGVVYVFNRGNSGATYSVDLVDRVMLEDGQILAVDEIAPSTAGAEVAERLASARGMITFSPRRVTLGPGESQTIRVRVLTPPGLAAGEYRTHLTVATLPPEDTGLTAEQAGTLQDGQLATRVTALLALSIPLIVRQDVSSSQPNLDDVRLQPRPATGDASAPATVALRLTRSGIGSVYGNLEVVTQPANGKAEVIGAVKGIAVYPEIGSRAVAVPLLRAPAAGERLQVRFTEDDASPAKPLAIADVE